MESSNVDGALIARVFVLILIGSAIIGYFVSLSRGYERYEDEKYRREVRLDRYPKKGSRRDPPKNDER